MKRWIFIWQFLALLIISEARSQNYINLGTGFSETGVKPWNKTIDAYNYARPWLSEPLPRLGASPVYQFGFTSILAKALFISPQLAYMRSNLASRNEGFETRFRLHRFSGSVNFDIYPREFGLDTVSFVIRPFLRLGGGATAFLPRIRFNDELATINDERYDPVIWTYQFHAGIGCRFSVTRWFDVMPVILVNYYPNVDLENYAQALHGTKSPGLTNAAAFLKPEFSLFFCFRMGQGKEN